MSILEEARKKYAEAKLNEKIALTDLKNIYSANFINNNPEVISKLCDYLKCKTINFLETDSFISSDGNHTEYVIVNTDTDKYAVVIETESQIDMYYYEYRDPKITVRDIRNEIDDSEYPKYETLHDKLLKFAEEWKQIYK